MALASAGRSIAPAFRHGMMIETKAASPSDIGIEAPQQSRARAKEDRGFKSLTENYAK